MRNSLLKKSKAGVTMFMEERHKEILILLEKEGRIKASDIQTTFDVGFDTARRDLRILEEKGLLKRTHGGAIPALQRGHTTPPKYTPRDIIDIKDNYWAIAKKGISFIKENDVVFLTAASVGFFMVQNLPKEFPFTAVTNSIIIADELRKYDNITTIFVGGEMSKKGQCSDSFATEFVKNIRFDISFLTSAGFTASFGASIQKSKGVSFLQAVLDSSKCKIALYPNEKIGAESILKVCSADKFDILITDWEAVEDELLKIEELGVNVIVVNKEQEH
jgi:DeoR family fructose operon transcriptional repressor